MREQHIFAGLCQPPARRAGQFLLQLAVNEGIERLTQAQLKAVGNEIPNRRAHRGPPGGRDDDVDIGGGAVRNDVRDGLSYVLKLRVGRANVVPAVDNQEGLARFRPEDKPGNLIDDAADLFAFFAPGYPGNVR